MLKGHSEATPCMTKSTLRHSTHSPLKLQLLEIYNDFYLKYVLISCVIAAQVWQLMWRVRHSWIVKMKEMPPLLKRDTLISRKKQNWIGAVP